MLARSRELELTSGAKLHTPLLIPSLSSRGFDVMPDGLSEVAHDFETAIDFLAQAILISAYDIHHRHLPEPEGLAGHLHWDSVWSLPQLVVIDSGGYELGAGWDGSELRRGEREPLPFTENDYRGVLERLPGGRDIAIVTWDHASRFTSRGYEEQGTAAERLASTRPDLMVDFLLKPQNDRRFHQPCEVYSCLGTLRSAHMIGVTEPDLGDTILDRARTLAQLRSLLDQAEISAPIHVFGVLDPVLVTLYFLAGAEVFDGLAWLRYGVYNGLSVHREAAALLNGFYDTPVVARRAIRQLAYLAHLDKLKHNLRAYVNQGKDIEILGQHQGLIEPARRIGLLD